MQIFETEKLVYFAVENNNLLPSFQPYEPFKALVIIDREIAKEVRFLWADWLIETPCRYMLAWGFECSKWDDDIDDTVVIKKIELENQQIELWQGIPLNDYHIMTSWHEQDTLAEVIDCCLQADEYDEQKTDWTWIIDFYNIKNRLPILETFLKYHAKPR